MKMMKYFLAFLILVCCADEPKTKSATENIKPKNSPVQKSKSDLNISILLDLSDRINPEKYPNSAMEYYLRDVNYIKSISEAFNLYLRRKKVREMNDKIQLFFEPEPSNQNINALSNSLKYSVNRQNVSLELLDEIKNVYATKPLEIYNLAIEDGEYVGSDTWRFLKSKVNDYCIENGYRNILIILTDGYIYHKDGLIEDENLTTFITPQYLRRKNLNTKDWKNIMDSKNFGFIPANSDLSDLEILVLGINADNKNPFEEDVIMKYWSDWFDKMKVKRYEIKTAELPSNMDSIIQDFILDE
jgi:hypothetical protein